MICFRLILTLLILTSFASLTTSKVNASAYTHICSDLPPKLKLWIAENSGHIFQKEWKFLIGTSFCYNRETDQIIIGARFIYDEKMMGFMEGSNNFFISPYADYSAHRKQLFVTMQYPIRYIEALADDYLYIAIKTKRYSYLRRTAYCIKLFKITEETFMICYRYNKRKMVPYTNSFLKLNGLETMDIQIRPFRPLGAALKISGDLTEHGHIYKFFNIGIDQEADRNKSIAEEYSVSDVDMATYRRKSSLNLYSIVLEQEVGKIWGKLEYSKKHANLSAEIRFRVTRKGNFKKLSVVRKSGNRHFDRIVCGKVLEDHRFPNFTVGIEKDSLIGTLICSRPKDIKVKFE